MVMSSRCPRCEADGSLHTSVCLECGYDRTDVGGKLIAADNGLRQKEATREWWRGIFHFAWLVSAFPSSGGGGGSPVPPAVDVAEPMTDRHGFAVVMSFGMIGLIYLLISDAHWTWRALALLAGAVAVFVDRVPFVHADLKRSISVSLALGLGIVGFVHWMF